MYCTRYKFINTSQYFKQHILYIGQCVAASDCNNAGDTCVGQTATECGQCVSQSEYGADGVQFNMDNFDFRSWAAGTIQLTHSSLLLLLLIVSSVSCLIGSIGMRLCKDKHNKTEYDLVESDQDISEEKVLL